MDSVRRRLPVRVRSPLPGINYSSPPRPGLSHRRGRREIAASSSGAAPRGEREGANRGEGLTGRCPRPRRRGREGRSQRRRRRWIRVICSTSSTRSPPGIAPTSGQSTCRYGNDFEELNAGIPVTFLLHLSRSAFFLVGRICQFSVLSRGFYSGGTERRGSLLRGESSASSPSQLNREYVRILLREKGNEEDPCDFLVGTLDLVSPRIFIRRLLRQFNEEKSLNRVVLIGFEPGSHL